MPFETILSPCFAAASAIQDLLIQPYLLARSGLDHDVPLLIKENAGPFGTLNADGPICVNLDRSTVPTLEDDSPVFKVVIQGYFVPLLSP